MVEKDAQLIRRILSGDDEAFNTLVCKYQKSVHALAWRKIGDFHFAEEIAQDTFLQAYKNLAMLKDPNQFGGWLYVIANRLCLKWIQRNKPVMQSLEDTSMREVERSSYTRYVSEQRETEATERRYAIVKRLLERLPESERTVVTLYYLGEMTAKEIGKFLGVSVNTIKSRLRRARERLKNDEPMIREMLGGVHLSTNFAESIMRQIADMKPALPPVGKPLLPWAAVGTVTLLIVLLMGVSSRYVPHFQQPYSFEAQSEPTIEIVDVPAVLDIPSKPAIRNRVGRAATPSKQDSTGLQVSETILASDASGDSTKTASSRWTQMNGLQGGATVNLFATSKGAVYAIAGTGIYRFAKGSNTWTLIDRSVPIFGDYVITEHGDTLYIATDRLYASTDGGESWDVLGGILPRGYTTGFAVTDEAQEHDPKARTAMYLALLDKGVFQSTDMGKQWNSSNNGLAGKKIYALAAVKNRVFAGTNQGLYRLNTSGAWEQLPIGMSEAIHALEVFENDLYVKTGPDPFARTEIVKEVNHGNNTSSRSFFLSSDLGVSWTDITPEDESTFVRTVAGIKFLPISETSLTQDKPMFYPGYGEDAPINLRSVMDLFMLSRRPLVAVDENTYYRAGIYGTHLTTDGGNSWHPSMKGMVGSGTLDLILFNDHLYLHTYEGIYKSTDGGASWGIVYAGYLGYSKVAIVNNVFYLIVNEWDTHRVLCLSTDGNPELIPIRGMPDFDGETLVLEFWTEEHFEGLKQADLAAGRPLIKNVPATYYLLDVYGRDVGGFAVSGGTFYIEYLRRLFKWKQGDSEWTNTGLIDTGEQPNSDLDREFKLAVSAETVYVGKRDGRLFQSYDGGDNWRDLTSSLPLRFDHFKEIVFTGSTVYVATDKGVLGSQTGSHWHVITDKIGMPVVIDKFTVNNTEVFGIGDTGVYRLDDRGKWSQISPTVSDKTASLITSNNSSTQVAWEFDPPDTDRVVSLVANKDKLYVSTYQLGIFQISLEEE
jgi:RNA polymerase sigma factor (sigma-70 family)